MNKIYSRIITASLSLCILTSLMTSCIEEYNAALPTSESNLLVVEGTILSDSTSTFYLSLSMPVNSTDPVTNINNATIQLKGDDGTLINGQLTGNGTYAIDTPKLNANSNYSVVITYDGDTYESDAQKPFPSVAVQNVEANQPTETSDVNILVTTAVPDNPSEIQYYRWTYKETWEVHPEIYSVYIWDSSQQVAVNNNDAYARRGWKFASSGDIIASSSAYYGNNQIVQYKLYDIPRSDRRLYVLYSTEVTQRSLTKAEYEYETERKKISNEMGGLFTPQPSALPTNIHCTTGSKRALGYIGCSLNVASYRLFASPETLKVQHKYTCEEISSDDEEYPGEQQMADMGYLLASYLELPGVGVEYDWASPTCIDITKLGCVTEKPSYWPN